MVVPKALADQPRGLLEQLVQVQGGRHLAAHLADGLELDPSPPLVGVELGFLHRHGGLIGHGRKHLQVGLSIGIAAEGLGRQGSDCRLAGQERDKEGRSGWVVRHVCRRCRKRVQLPLEVLDQDGLLGFAQPIDQPDARFQGKRLIRFPLALAHPEFDGILVFRKYPQMKYRGVDNAACTFIEQCA
jgi:hypothetical protein